MILINKKEAAMVREVFKESVHIRRTCPQKSNRHRYHLEENPWAMKALEEFRKGTNVDALKQAYGRYKNQSRFY